MNLRSIIHQLRAQRATINQIDIILALIEANAMRDLFFNHVPDEEKIDILLAIVRMKSYEWPNQFDREKSEESFLDYLATSQELHFNPKHIKEIISKIKEKGEEHYEFTRIDRLDKENPGPENPAQ